VSIDYNRTVVVYLRQDNDDRKDDQITPKAITDLRKNGRGKCSIEQEAENGVDDDPGKHNPSFLLPAADEQHDAIDDVQEENARHTSNNVV